MKIVKAYPILEPTLHQSVTEAGWLDRISQGLGMGKGVAKPAPTPDVARSTATAEVGDPLGHVVGTIVKPLTTGQVRFVLHLDRAELTSLYLKDDPASHLALAKALLGVKEGAERFSLHALVEDPATGEPNDPDSVAAAAKDAGVAQPAQPAQPAKPAVAAGTPKPAAKPKQKVAPKPKITLAHPMSSGYKFSDLLKGAGGKDYTVLLDVPSSVAAAYTKAPSPEALAQMMNHKYYATTISNSRAAKIAPQLDAAAGDIDAEMTAFNPDIIVNYPAAQTIKQAKIEWNEKYQGKHQELTGAKPQPAAPTATPTTAPPTASPAAGAEKELSPSGEGGAKPAEAAALTTSKLKATHDTLLALARTMPSKGAQGGQRKQIDQA